MKNKAFDQYCNIQDAIEDLDKNQICDRDVVEGKYIEVHTKFKTAIPGRSQTSISSIDDVNNNCHNALISTASTQVNFIQIQIFRKVRRLKFIY